MSATNKITPSVVENMAALSRLAVTDEEKQDMAKKLSDIMDHFSVIQRVNTKDIVNADNSTGLENVTRADVVETPENKICTTQKLLDAAPKTHEQYIKVPEVFE